MKTLGHSVIRVSEGLDPVGVKVLCHALMSHLPGNGSKIIACTLSLHYSSLLEMHQDNTLCKRSERWALRQCYLHISWQQNPGGRAITWTIIRRSSYAAALLLGLWRWAHTIAMFNLIYKKKSLGLNQGVEFSTSLLVLRAQHLRSLWFGTVIMASTAIKLPGRRPS